MFGRKITISILFALFAVVPAAYDPGLFQRAVAAALSGQLSPANLDQGRSLPSAINNLNYLTNIGVVTPLPPAAGSILSQYGYNSGYNSGYGSYYPNYNYNYASSYPSSSYNYASSSYPSFSYNYAATSYPNYNYGSASNTGYNYGSYSYPSYNYASYGKK